MSADLLALLDRDPAAGILAAADLREQRATAATPGPWGDPDDVHVGDFGWTVTGCPAGETEDSEQGRADAVYIAAEHPGVALAAVRRWRGAVERHVQIPSSAAASGGSTDQPLLSICDYDERPWPCPDLTETADEARAYLGGAT